VKKRFNEENEIKGIERRGGKGEREKDREEKKKK
jgi:hypothetical protein